MSAILKKITAFMLVAALALAFALPALAEHGSTGRHGSAGGIIAGRYARTHHTGNGSEAEYGHSGDTQQR